MSSSNSDDEVEQNDNGAPQGMGPYDFPRDINQPWTWTPELADNPQWMWLSHHWIKAKRVPELTAAENFHPIFSSYSQKWLDYVTSVRDAPNTKTNNDVPSLRLFPYGSPAHSDPAQNTGAPQNGPFIVNYLRGDGTPIPSATFFIVPGDFWIESEKNPHPDHIFLQAGVFVGFRRKGRLQKNAWWWECVYANLDKRGRVVLRAYCYNYLGMPLTRGPKWRCQVREGDVLWIESSRGRSAEERRVYVESVVEGWSGRTDYHTHGFMRNGLRKDFDVPPYRF
ncbi:hypothetical protein VTL71DRAFT_2618 [Oculimacula yallundae]|uniref:Uncharacterized protein n=1 Tax=Oculimacula yallundae TaxID=86028 RepID=A0ABR4C9C5_9HELO